MKTAHLIFIVVCAILMAYIGYSVLSVTKGKIMRYNCSIAEISPDIPLEVKQQCRERNVKQNQGNSQ